MKKLILSFALLTSFSILTNAQESTETENISDSKKIGFYESPDFDYSPKYVIAMPKRDGINSYKDLYKNEIRSIRREAKKNNCSMVICDFDYQTPETVTDYDEEAENEKKEFFYFYISNRPEEVVEK